MITASAAITTDVLSNRPSAADLTQTAQWFVAILGAYTVVYVLLAPRVTQRLNPWVSTVLFYGPVRFLPTFVHFPTASASPSPST